MSNYEQYEIQQKIAQIIERSRHQEEMFLVDSKTAASDIWNYLKNKNILGEYFTESIDHNLVAA